MMNIVMPFEIDIPISSITSCYEKFKNGNLGLDLAYLNIGI